MRDVSLAFLWHQHQPYYPDDFSGENRMPWVRLHAAKDYWGMAALLEEVPQMHATINLVPSLVKQILAYEEPGYEDAHLRISRRPADGLTEDEMALLLDDFFMAHPERMIHPFPRYRELYQQRGLGVDTAKAAARRFNKRDVIDLVCWANLVWIHPLALERDKELAEFREKGSHWTEEEKQWLLDKQLELVAEVIPLHRKLAQRGQIELTTTPFYHPILPLLWDKRLARHAMPDVELPSELEAYQADAVEQIERGVQYHEQVFGKRPRGMWPSEGSVCQEIIPAIAAAGIEWIATDEEILSASTDGWVARDGQGFLRNPEMLYRPWYVEEKGSRLQVVFRDHAVSDLIGFHYQGFRTDQAVDDFVGRMEAIGKATAAGAADVPTLVSVILDGENCWEYYPSGGVEFLRKLYRRIARHGKITPTCIGDHLNRYPATDKLGRLFAGSWISHNFGIWIGHPECNHAWDALHASRQAIVAAETSRSATPEQIAAGREELYIAEGSDWFWWYGDDHNSAQDGLFDELFRKHLQNVYAALGQEVPPSLQHAIRQGHQARRLHTEPTGLLNVKIDGRQTYFEWRSAGHCQSQGSRGTMSMADAGPVSDLFFGFDTTRLLLRLDTAGAAFREQCSDTSRMRVTFFEPEGFELSVRPLTARRPKVELVHRGISIGDSGVEAACDAIFEVAVPWRSLAAATDHPIHFFVELLEGDHPTQRIPVEGMIETFVPSPDYELIMWQA